MKRLVCKDCGFSWHPASQKDGIRCPRCGSHNLETEKQKEEEKKGTDPD